MKLINKESVIEFVTAPSTAELGIKILAWIGAFLAPIQKVLFAVGFLIITDTITGIWAAVKEDQKIQSFKLRRSITKSAAYLLAIVCGYVTQNLLLDNAIPIVTVVAGLIGATESLSVYENLTRITGVQFKQKVLEILQPPKVEDTTTQAPELKKEDEEPKA